MELRDYLRLLRKRWLAIVVAAVLGGGAGAAYSLAVEPRYEASTLVFVYVQSGTTVGDLAQGSLFAQNQVKSYSEAVNTPRVLDSVIRGMQLDMTSAELAESVSASAPLDSVNIEITVSDSSPARAARIANAVTESFQRVIADITRPAEGPSQVSISVLRSAAVPDEPVEPNLRLNIAIGVLAGLVLGALGAILLHVLDTRVRSIADVEEITPTPIVGRIVRDKLAAKRPLIVQDDPFSPRAEAFRSMRTNIQFLEVDNLARSFAVTSATADEGKTTTIANLAIAMAASGSRVVLVDADLRRPTLATHLGIEGAVGLSDVLISRVELSDVLQRWGAAGLTILPAGTIPPNPSELLGSNAMKVLVETLERDFDVVLFDLPPLLPVTDAAVVSGMVGGALLVVAAGKVRKAEVSAAVGVLEKVNAPIAGIVMTMLPFKGPDSASYRGYAYAASSE